MKFNRIFFFILAVSVSILLSACGGVPASNWPGVASDGKTIYVTNVNFIHMVQASDGRPVTAPGADGVLKPLRFPAQNDGSLAFYTAPAVTADGGIIVGNGMASGYQFYNTDPNAGAHLLYNVDTTTGTPKWAFAEAKGIWLGSAIVSGDGIYAPSGNGKVYALDLNGKKRWEASVSAQPLWSAPATDGKLVFISTLDHEIIALDLQTGTQRWNVELDASIVSTPAVANGSLYVGTLSGSLYALNAADGSEVWQVTLKDNNLWSTPVADGDTLYVGTSEGTAGKLYAINIANGQTVWIKNEASSIIASPLVLPEQVVYVTEAGQIQSLNKNGTIKWDAKIDGAKIYTAPILAGDFIIVAPMHVQPILAAYDLTGNQKWTFAPAN
jgi:outer membrane protein assembly factor BamB